VAAALGAPRALVPDAALALRNPSWEGAAARILIVRLSPFRDVDRSSSHLLLFSETRAALPEAFIDFAFLPDRRDREILATSAEPGEGPRPWFYGLASLRGPDHFDLVLVSCAFGLELINLAWLFTTSGLPLRASQRRGAAALPLVILGGSAAAATGPLVVDAGDSMIDGLFVGEGEGLIGPLAALLSRRDRTPASRLEEARALPGFMAFPFPPGESPSVAPRRLPSSPPPLLTPPALNSDEAATARLQITAGCPGLCSFCFEGWDRRPYRELPYAEVLVAARALKRATGAVCLEVYSFNFNTHEDIAPLIFELGRIFRRVNLMSQRLDILAGLPSLVAAELAADKRSFTLGIEGISARMRAFYRKGLAEEELERLFDLLLVRGIKELKLFYIIAGLETAEDCEDFASFMLALGARRDNQAPGLRILVSAGFLVRLPRTPLQYAPLALDEEPLRKIARRMEASCAAIQAEFRLAVHFDEYCVDQVLALGDGRLLPWLEATPSQGQVYDGGLSRGVWPSLKAAAREAALLDPVFLGEKDETYRPPLFFLESDPDLLWREYRAARAGKDREACLGEACCGCGACPDADSITFITGHKSKAPEAALVEKIAKLTAAKAGFEPLLVSVDLPPELAGATPAYMGAWLTRRLLAHAADAELFLFESREALFSDGSLLGLPQGFTGRTVFALYGPRPDRLLALARAEGLEPLSSLPRVRKARLALVLSQDDDEALAGFRGFLARAHVTGTEYAEKTGRRFVVSARDEKKAIVHEASFAFGGGSVAVDLVLGFKARLSDWLEAGPSASVRVLELGL
jgi:radical SAM superfamily enzyme YgiQ (UPF0313 family)